MHCFSVSSSHDKPVSSVDPYRVKVGAHRSEYNFIDKSTITKIYQVSTTFVFVFHAEYSLFAYLNLKGPLVESNRTGCSCFRVDSTLNKKYILSFRFKVKLMSRHVSNLQSHHNII